MLFVWKPEVEPVRSEKRIEAVVFDYTYVVPYTPSWANEPWADPRNANPTLTKDECNIRVYYNDVYYASSVPLEGKPDISNLYHEEHRLNFMFPAMSVKKLEPGWYRAKSPALVVPCLAALEDGVEYDDKVLHGLPEEIRITLRSADNLPERIRELILKHVPEPKKEVEKPASLIAAP